MIILNRDILLPSLTSFYSPVPAAGWIQNENMETPFVVRRGIA
jgi:hypothetical protein